MAKTTAERFWAKVDKRGSVPEGRPDLGSCWLWIGAKTRGGYGHMQGDGGRGVTRAHRLSYELLVGPIPEGLHIDHLCRNRACVNPEHLEPVTPRENLLRGRGFVAVNAAATHCPNGHPYDEANTYRWRGSRRCRACNLASWRRSQARKKRSGGEA